MSDTGKISDGCIPVGTAHEHTDIVRRRRFQVGSIEEVVDVLIQLKRERFEGSVRIDIRCGGTPTCAEAEQRQKISELDTTLGVGVPSTL